MSDSPRTEAGISLVPYVYGVALVANQRTAFDVQAHVLESVLAIEADGLDAAWAAVEAALWEGSVIISPSRTFRDGSRSPVRVEARTGRPTAGRRGPRWFHWYGERRHFGRRAPRPRREPPGGKAMTAAIQWACLISIALLLMVAFVGWVEADPERTARWERVGYRVFGDGPRP